MAKINVKKDFSYIESGTYVGTINKAIMCQSGKVMLKIALEDGSFFISFHEVTKFGSYPFNHLFMAVNSDELEDIVGLRVRFEIKNKRSTKTDKVFSNIKKIKAID